MSMGADSIALPDGVRLKGTPQLAYAPPTWEGNPLRRSLRISVATAGMGFAAVVMFFAYSLGSVIAPFTASYQHIDGTVTGLVHVDSRADRQCTLTIAFALAGGQFQGTSSGPVACATAPPAGTVLQIAVDPRVPQDVHVVDPRSNAGAWPWLVGFGAIAVIGASGVYLRAKATTYRRVRRLASLGPDWHELTAVMKGHLDRGGDTLLLEAEDTAGASRLFLLSYRGQRPWRPLPRSGDRLEFAVATDGTGVSILSTAGDPRLWLVRLYVPNNTELRAMGA